MALYPPIINESYAMQTKTSNNAINIHYNRADDTQPRTFEVTAINPRTGASVLKEDKDSTLIVNTLEVSDKEDETGIITIYISDAIAQITLKSKDTEGNLSIPSKAVIFKLFDETIEIVPKNTIIDSSPYRFMASVTFTKSGDGTANDELAWYQIILKSTDGTILAQTDKCYPKTKNTIDEFIDYDFWFKVDDKYTFDIIIGTRNGISKTKIDIEWTLDPNILRIPADLKGTVTQEFNGSNGFDVTWVLPTGSQFYKDIDYTAILYYKVDQTWIAYGSEIVVTPARDQRQITFQNLTTPRTRATQYRIVLKDSDTIENITDVFWHSAYGEDILLQDSTDNFFVKYNPEISQMKRNISDVITPTLGAKYPFTYRNGHQNYRTFSIGGLIARADTDTDKPYYGTNEDVLQERLLREEILEFLYNDKIKLFSSAQEGEMLIKLSGVSLTPMKQLGRMLYSFSATATEVADCTEENLAKYGIEG